MALLGWARYCRMSDHLRGVTVPKRTTRTITLARTRRTVLRVTELERRDTPAWWSVAAPVPAEGTVGVTDATHAGSLVSNPDYAPANGAATVWADTAALAVAKALTGTMSVTLSGQTVEHAFGPATVGATAADHKAYLAVVTGTSVSLAFEDMAVQPGCDYDYNDRSWGGVTVASTGDPVVPFDGPDTWLWHNPPYQEAGNVDETATVKLRVTRPDPDTFRWQYTLTNHSLSVLFSSPGINNFQVTPEDASLVTKMTTSMAGWEMDSSGGGVSWWMKCLSTGPYLPIGDTATFGFDTPPVPITAAYGGVGVAGVGGGGENSMAHAVEGYGDEMAASSMNSPTHCASIDNGAGGDAKGPGVPLKAALQTVTFSSANGNYFDVKADPGDAPYKDAPHWNDPDTDGIINVVNVDRQLPVGYVQSTKAVAASGTSPAVAAVDSKIRVKATFKVTQGDAPNGVWVRGDGPGDYDVPWTKATLANNVITLEDTEMIVKLAAKVDHFPSFDIKWQFSTFGGLAPKDAGTSKNELFVSIAKSQLPADKMFVTPLWLFCKSAKGSEQVDEAITKAFINGYEGKVATTHPDLDPLYADPARPMYYYKDWTVTNASFMSMVASTQIGNNGLPVANPYRYDGTCMAWVDTFARTLFEGGIKISAANRYMIAVPTGFPASLLVISKWDFTKVGTANAAPYTHANTFASPPYTFNGYPTFDRYARKDADNNWEYYWGANPEVTDDKSGLGGQNTTNPRSTFSNHFFVRIGDTIYDPSYGKAFSAAGTATMTPWDAACHAWENASLAGHAINKSYQLPDGISYEKFVFAESNKTELDTIISYAPWENL